VDYISDFIYAMDEADLSPLRPSDIIPTGGAWKAYHLAADRKKSPKGAYRLTIDDMGAVGQFKDFRISETITWHSKLANVPQEKRAEMRDKIKKAREEEQAARKEEQAAAALEAKAIWRACVPAMEHPYLKKKGIGAHGAKIDDQGNLVLPRYDMAGKIWTIQTITAGGVKEFMKGGRAKGTFMPLMDKADPRDVLLICEGFSTGASLRECTGLPVFVAFSAGNLAEVARDVRKKYPDAMIVMCGDNDAFTFKSPRHVDVASVNKNDVAGDDERWNQWRDAGYLHNDGIHQAMAAAYAVNGLSVYPEFKKDDLADKPTDFNDLHMLYGDKIVKAVIDDVLTRSKPPEPSHEMPPESINYIPAQPDYESFAWMERIIWKDERAGIYHKDHATNNAALILTHQQPIGGCFVYDEFLSKQTIIKPLPWDDPKTFTVREMSDVDLTRTKMWLEHIGISLHKSTICDILAVVCDNRRVNPATDYLDSLVWDGEPRLDTVPQKYLRATNQDPAYVSRVFSCFMLAAAKRIYRPGTPFHHMLILEGGQAAKKSSVFRALATFGRDAPRAYFADHITFDMIERPDFPVHAAGNVILEFQELTGMTAKDRNRIKQFITIEVDHYRKPHQHVTTKFPRQFVMAGTVNDMQYLNDPTGGRRFWPISVGDDIDLEGLKEVTEHLWAEAVHRAKSGEIWYIDKDDPIYSLMEKEQASRYIGHPWDDIIANYVEHMDTVKIEDIYTDVLKIDRGKWDRRTRSDICSSLSRAGFVGKVMWDNAAKKSMWKWIRKDSLPKEEEVEF